MVIQSRTRPSAALYLWKLVVIFFPVTTFPLLPLGQTVVKPLSFLPLACLAVLLLVNNHLRLQIHRETKILFWFMLYCSSIPFLHSLIMFGGDALATYIRSIFTLFIGLLFYSTFRIMNKTIVELEKTELLLNNAMVFSVLVAVLQFVIRKFIPGLSIIPDTINYLLVDVVGEWTDRFHGLALEPSWLASQLTLITIPLSVARLLSNQTIGYSITPLGKIKKEYIYITFGLIGVLLSGSRTGLIALIFMALIVVLSNLKLRFYWIHVLSILVLSVIIYASSELTDYVGIVFQAIYQSSDIMQIVLLTHVAPRVSAWVTSYEVFTSNPIIGVGLGNSFRFYSELMPAWAMDFDEAVGWSDGESYPNPKNMILKLLSETGLIGILIFLIFVSRHLFLTDGNYQIRILSRLILVALLFNYFSMDTFALPTEWFALAYLISLKTFKVGIANRQIT